MSMENQVLVNLVQVSVPEGQIWRAIFPNGGSITVSPDESDTITWVLDSTAPPGAALAGVFFCDGQPGNRKWAGPVPSAPNWSTTDLNTLPDGSPLVAWAYRVMILYDGTVYTSDPEITNKPPTG
jgi:hypothetical protein